MTRAVVAAVAVCLLATGCLGGSGAQTRTVLVDFASDQFAGAFLSYFPHQVEVRQGDTVVFKQTWTGEPHSVTMGSLADSYASVLAPYMQRLQRSGYNALPQPEPKTVSDVEKKIPFMFQGFGPGPQKVAQNGAQPCYLSSGMPPTNPDTPCPKAEQREPAFTGRQSFYNSGYIHYAGPSGNTFRVKIAPDAKPGKYFFFCNNHGPLMSGYLVVEQKTAKIPSQDSVNKEALRESNAAVSPLAKDYAQQRSQGIEIPPDSAAQARDIAAKAGFTLAERGGHLFYTGDAAGFGGPPDTPKAEGLAFIPKTPTVKAGQKLTWVVGGDHTISFGVPSYFPIFTVRSDGTVVRNPLLDVPAGGSPKLPAPDKFGDVVIDAGTWDGHTFFSSGLLNAEEGVAVYSVRISRPGTDKFACLIHPEMVGTITVTS